ncbi:hypothetical protein RRG08_038384 [Elysia crispata]|uniref:Uncharacterized protein n=1 Tax=Elysia crispata TaxID=231223 RepID=A0AAE1A7X0_9GAST|nr:hypothetical protein RRG08_038384 [Elysia crispata]
MGNVTEITPVVLWGTWPSGSRQWNHGERERNHVSGIRGNVDRLDHIISIMGDLNYQDHVCGIMGNVNGITPRLLSLALPVVPQAAASRQKSILFYSN